MSSQANETELSECGQLHCSMCCNEVDNCDCDSFYDPEETAILAEARGLNKQQPDPVNHPSHYNSHPSGIEAIEVCEHFPFWIGNVIKYLWRAGLKNDAIEDLKKARWYLTREIEKREKEAE